MASKGTKPKPTAMKILAGARKDRINTAEPARVATRVNPPAGLSAPAVEEWWRVQEVLETARVWSAADAPALALYVQSWDRHRVAIEALGYADWIIEQRTGEGISPWLRVVWKEADVMLRLLTEFGLTPSSRSKVKASSEQPAGKLRQYVS